MVTVIPAPMRVEPVPGAGFTIAPRTAIHAGAGSAALSLLERLLGGPANGVDPVGTVSLELSEELEAGLGSEGYELTVAEDGVRIRAYAEAGLFYGVQTLRQLLPASAETGGVPEQGWHLASVRIVDRPRYAYRGFMIDVARYFLGPDSIKRLIDDIVLYKINYLHLHLTDDQGWRIAVDSWPRLASYGGGTDVADGFGGYYTRSEYVDLVEYAAARFVTVVPEIDLPGHTNAALASYPELNADGHAPDRYTGIEVGFSGLAAHLDVTYRFIDDVVGEVAAMTPGEFIHIGGDEVKTLTAEEYATIVERAQEIVARHGKRAIGWHEIGKAVVAPGNVVQYWGTDALGSDAAGVVECGADAILSPARHAYLDQKYTPESRLGLSWAALVEVADAYAWDPGTHLPGLAPQRVLGLEAPLWTETVRTVEDAEELMFPRLPAIAELAWSPPSRHDWSDFRVRLANQAPRWTVLGCKFHASPQIDWPGGHAGGVRPGTGASPR
jgi:hexosaminidase